MGENAKEVDDTIPFPALAKVTMYFVKQLCTVKDEVTLIVLKS